MAGAPMGGGQPQQSNVYNQASNAYGSALNTTGAATNMAANTPTMTAGTQQATAQGYKPFTGLDAQGQALAGFGAGSASGGGYDAEAMARARDVQAGQFAGTNLDPYMNPYIDNVVNRTTDEMERARLIQQNQADTAMQQAGAFGGSRHGIANAETNRGFYDQLGQTTAGLYNTGYQNAQQAAFQDIGNTMQADLANQGADLTTNQYNAEAVNQARRTGANNSTRASIANANAQTQLAGQRLGAVNDASRFGAGAMNDMSRFNAGQGNQMNQFNASAINQGEQNRFGNLMAGGSQMSGLAGQGFDMGNQITNQQMQQGALSRQMNQQLIDAARQQYGNYTNAGNLGLSPLAQFASGNYGGTSTESSNPGLLGTLGTFAAFL